MRHIVRRAMTRCMALAIYDMDLTITQAPTYTRWLVFWAWHRAPWRLALLPAAAVMAVAYRLKLVSRAQLKEIAQYLLMGGAAKRSDVERLAQAFAARVSIMPGALTQLAADRATGLDIVMATASFDFYVQAIAARLDIVTVVATRSVWDSDLLRAQIDGENCYGADKASMVGNALPGNVLVRAYSDHVSDAPLFAMAAEPVAVNPSRGLRVLANAKGWRIVDWR